MDKIKIEMNQFKSKPQKIGELNGKPVLEGCTMGGLWVNMVQKNGKNEIIGVGSHRQIARFLSERENPSIKIDSLHKSEQLPDEVLAINLPYFEDLLKRISEI